MARQLQILTQPYPAVLAFGATNSSEDIMKRLFAPILLLAVIAAILPAGAQERQSFRALVSAGYEIKNVAVIPIEVSKRYDEKSSTDTVAITLQKSKSVAVCYLNLSNWINLLSASLEDNSRCDVRSW